MAITHQFPNLQFLLCNISILISFLVRSFIKRSLSDGNLLCESDSLVTATKVVHNKAFSEEQGVCKGLSDSTPEISTCESDMSYSRSVLNHISILVTSPHHFLIQYTHVKTHCKVAYVNANAQESQACKC